MEVDEYSNAVIEELWAHHPEWRDFAHIEKVEGEEKGYFYLEIPSLSVSDLASPLCVLTNNQEITVGLDYYHAHYDSMVGLPEESDTDKALPFIEDLLAEKVSVVSWWDGNTWKGSSCVKSGSEPEASDFAVPYKKIRVRSWKGTYDRDIDA